MSTDAHTPLPQKGPFADNSPTDMPAARTIVILVVVLLAVFSVVAAIIHFTAEEAAPDGAPVIEQRQPDVI